MKKKKLVLLPYAGGSGMFYRHWNKFLDDQVILSPIELPGRGLRYKEPLCDNFNDTINCIFPDVQSAIENDDYIFFGYCIGTVIVYELFKQIADKGLKHPFHCMLCAHPAPNLPLKGEKYEDMLEEELMIEWMRGSDITNKELSQKPYLYKLFEVWKSDCRMMDSYVFTNPIYKFDCDITIINGTDDELYTEKELNSWRNYTTGNCYSFLVEGSHDFMKKNELALIEVIRRII